MSKNEENEYAKAFPTGGFRKSWKRFDKVVDAMPFEDELEAEDWKERLRDDRKLRYAMLKDKTEAFKRMLRARLRPERNFIIMISGPMGSGKSVLEAIICWFVQQEIPGTNFKVVMGIDEIRAKLKTLKPHGIVVNDEDLNTTGMGSDTVATHYSNQLKFARSGERNLILSAKFYENIKIANYYCEMFGFNERTGESRFMLRGRSGRWLGVVTLKKEYPKEFYQPFLDAKARADAKLARTKGEVSAFSDFDVKASVAAIEQQLRHCKFPSMRKSHIRAFIIQQSELEENKDKPEFQVPQMLLSDVIARIQINLMQRPIEKEHKAKSRGGGISHKLQKHVLRVQVEYEKLLYLILDQLVVAGADMLKKDVFKLKCAGESNLDISRMLGIATGSVSNYYHEILREYLGNASEDAFCLVLDEEGVDYVHGGYNSPDPDFIIRSRFELIKCSVFPYVVSFKSYYIFRVNKAMSEIAASEVSFALEHGCPLFLVAYECRTGLLRIFEVLLERGKLASSSSCESRNPPGGLNTPSLAAPTTTTAAQRPPPPPPPSGGWGCSRNGGAPPSSKGGKKKKHAKRRRGK
ncbi:MAG: hypothetical protein ACTSQI_06120 [Candidatus Helarchaeota archaeon]